MQGFKFRIEGLGQGPTGGLTFGLYCLKIGATRLQGLGGLRFDDLRLGDEGLGCRSRAG